MDVHVNVYARVRSITFADVQKRKMCASGIVFKNFKLQIKWLKEMMKYLKNSFLNLITK